MKYIRLEVENHIAVVTLDRPKVNALNRAIRAEITAVFDELSERKDVRVAVLTGAGHVFCAGADLRDRPDPETPGDGLLHNRIVRETNEPIRTCAKPVIAAVNGAALGAGLGLAAACDIIYAAKGAMFAIPEINVGLAGGGAILQTLFGRSRMRRMMFTGESFPAEELYRLGIIEEATEPDRLMPTVMAVAAEIAAKNPLGIQYAKRSANLVELMSPRDSYPMEQMMTLELGKTYNAREARTAVLEKRAPVFRDE